MPSSHPRWLSMRMQPAVQYEAAFLRQDAPEPNKEQAVTGACEAGPRRGRAGGLTGAQVHHVLELPSVAQHAVGLHQPLHACSQPDSGVGKGLDEDPGNERAAGQTLPALQAVMRALSGARRRRHAQNAPSQHKWAFRRPGLVGRQQNLGGAPTLQAAPGQATCLQC